MFGATLVLEAGSNEVSKQSSKRELKYNIEDFHKVDLIDLLKPKTFYWKYKISSGVEESEKRKKIRESSKQIGFIAEEVAEIEDGILSLFEYDEDGNRTPEMYKYLDILALSVRAIQDLRERIKTLEEKLL
jgi:hypothetical protein